MKLWSYDLPINRGVSFTIEPDKTGPWSLYSIGEFKKQQDYVEIASAIHPLAKEVVGETNDPWEKARKIHQHVQTLYTTFLNDLRSTRTTGKRPRPFLDGLIEYRPTTTVVGGSWSDPLMLEMAHDTKPWDSRAARYSCPIAASYPSIKKCRPAPSFRSKRCR